MDRLASKHKQTRNLEVAECVIVFHLLTSDILWSSLSYRQTLPHNLSKDDVVQTQTKNMLPYIPLRLSLHFTAVFYTILLVQVATFFLMLQLAHLDNVFVF